MLGKVLITALRITLAASAVVLFAVGGLCAAAATGGIYVSQCSKQGTARNNDIPNIMNGLKTYRLQTGHYPSVAEGLRALVAHQILDRVPVDPWGNAYHYTLDGKLAVVTTYGDDGVPGGEDLATDISSNDLK